MNKDSNASDSPKVHIEVREVPARLKNMPDPGQNENVGFSAGAGKLAPPFLGPANVEWTRIPLLWDILGTWIRLSKNPFSVTMPTY